MLRILALIAFGALGYRFAHRQGEIDGRVAKDMETEAFHDGRDSAFEDMEKDEEAYDEEFGIYGDKPPGGETIH